MPRLTCALRGECVVLIGERVQASIGRRSRLGTDRNASWWLGQGQAFILAGDPLRRSRHRITGWRAITKLTNQHRV